MEEKHGGNKNAYRNSCRLSQSSFFICNLKSLLFLNYAAAGRSAGVTQGCVRQSRERRGDSLTRRLT